MTRTPKFTELFSVSQKRVDALFKDAQPIAGMYGMRILCNQQMDLEHSLFLIMPTRRFKGAVSRNKIRRQIKAIIFENELYKKPSGFVILLYPSIRRMPFEKIKEFLIESLS